jgi:hypothetical protein
MKRILFLLLFSTTMFGQAVFDEGIQNTAASTLTPISHISTMGADGLYGKVLPENIPLNILPPPLNYVPTSANIRGHYNGIDIRLGQIVQTTAGQTQRIWFTGDVSTVGGNPYYLSNPFNGGTVASVTQTVVNNDNAKAYFSQDVISNPFPSVTTFAAGTYGGQLSVRVSDDSSQERYTIEIYKTNNTGVPIASGIAGAPVGSLGVTVVSILGSGVIDLVQNSTTNISLSGTLGSVLTILAGERVRYHVSAEKIGTAGAAFTYSVFYGNENNSYYDAPVTVTTDVVGNKSLVGGITASDALNFLNINKANDANVVKLTGSDIKNGALNISTSGGVAPLAPLHVGNRGVMSSSNAQVLVSGNYNNSITGNGHGFSDGSNISKSGSWAYAAYDGRVDITGTSVNADHYVSFQHAPVYSFTGNISKNWGMYTTTSISSGTIDNNYGSFAANPIKTGTGTIGVNFGLYVQNQTAGTSNYSIYSEGGRNYFGGEIVTEGTIFASNQGGNIRFKFDGTSNDGALIAGGDGSLYFGNWGLGRGLKIKPNGNNEFLSGTVKAQPATASDELVTKSQLDAVAMPFKIYKALISQTGTNAPTANVLANTLGGSVTFTRVSGATYTINSSGLFTAGKTALFIGQRSTSGGVGLNWLSANTLNLLTLSDGALIDLSISIEVYPLDL